MTRWSVGDRLLGEIDGGYPSDLEIRTVEGSYWRREGGTWTALTGTATSVSSERLFDGGRPAVVTYVPPVPSPHTKPGHYVCSGACAYRFVLGGDGLWTGPYYPYRPTPPRNSKDPYTWDELQDTHGDCTRNLVGPVNPAVIRSL